MWKRIVGIIACSSLLLVGCNTNGQQRANDNTPAENIREGADTLGDDVREGVRGVEEDVREGVRDVEEGVREGVNDTNDTIDRTDTPRYDTDTPNDTSNPATRDNNVDGTAEPDSSNNHLNHDTNEKDLIEDSVDKKDRENVERR